MISVLTAKRMVARNMRLVPRKPGPSFKPVVFACEERPRRCPDCLETVGCPHGNAFLQRPWEDSDDIPVPRPEPDDDFEDIP